MRTRKIDCVKNRVKKRAVAYTTALFTNLTGLLA